MLISELTLYDFLKDKINLSNKDAKYYVKEFALAEIVLHAEMKIMVAEDIRKSQIVTREDIRSLELKFDRLQNNLVKGFRLITICAVGSLLALGILGILMIKLNP